MGSPLNNSSSGAPGEKTLTLTYHETSATSFKTPLGNVRHVRRKFTEAGLDPDADRDCIHDDAAQTITYIQPPRKAFRQ